jgi:hypothetical protein
MYRVACMHQYHPQNMSIQHVLSNGVVIASFPLCVWTLWNLSVCEATAADLQQEGVFLKNCNDENVSPLWDGCVTSSSTPLVCMLASLAVRAFCGGLAALLEMRRSNSARIVSGSHHWVYPPIVLAWVRWLCVGWRKPANRNVIEGTRAPLR